MSISAPDRPAPAASDRVGPVDFGDRHARRRRRVRIALVVLAVAVLAAAVWVVGFSSFLAVKVVRVVGVDDQRATQVLTTANLPVGVPLARVDTSAAQARVASLPWIASVDVRRGWPNEIVLAVEPRTPIAVLVAAEGRTALDSSGVAFDAAGAPMDGLPVVRASGPGVEAATSVLASLPAQLATATVSLSASSRDDVDLHLKSGVLVHWGSPERADVKAEVLLALMRHKADVYDVSAPELPTTFKKR